MEGNGELCGLRCCDYNAASADCSCGLKGRIEDYTNTHVAFHAALWLPSLRATACRLQEAKLTRAPWPERPGHQSNQTQQVACPAPTPTRLQEAKLTHTGESDAEHNQARCIGIRAVHSSLHGGPGGAVQLVGPCTGSALCRAASQAGSPLP